MPSNETAVRQRHRALRIAALVAAAAAAAIVADGVATRARNFGELERWAADQSVPNVSVVAPVKAADASTLELPGRLEAFAHAAVYARVNGYLKNWRVDIGTPVKAGELLGEIETPELEQQLLQARADLASAQASAALSATTARRWQAMLAKNTVSRQEVDEKTSDHAAREAMVKAAQANLDRLLATREFARVLAPFDGIVTARAAQTGALINAGSGNGPPLFEISDTRRLRLYVRVPQVYATSVDVGSRADITVPEHPGRTYTASVASMARAVDPASGTTLVQLLIDNAAGELLPGGFADVSLQLSSGVESFGIPASALIFDQSGLRVATVDADGKVRLKPVTIARDRGATIELGSGLGADDRVIENPPDGIGDGTPVHVVTTGATRSGASHGS